MGVRRPKAGQRGGAHRSPCQPNDCGEPQQQCRPQHPRAPRRRSPCPLTPHSASDDRRALAILGRHGRRSGGIIRRVRAHPLRALFCQLAPPRAHLAQAHLGRLRHRRRRRAHFGPAREPLQNLRETDEALLCRSRVRGHSSSSWTGRSRDVGLGTPGCWRGRAEKRGQRTTRRGVRSSRSGANAERWGRPLSSASGTRALRGGGMFALLRRLAPPTTSLQCYAARQSLDSAAGEPSGFDPAASLVPLAEWVFQTEGDPLNVVTSLWPRSVPADQPGPRDRR